MQDDICPMMAFWIGPKQLPVQHMRKPGKGVPVAAGLHVSEGPNEPFNGYPLLYVSIIGHIYRIVVVDKAVIANLPVTNQDYQTQR